MFAFVLGVKDRSAVSACSICSCINARHLKHVNLVVDMAFNVTVDDLSPLITYGGPWLSNHTGQSTTAYPAG